LFLHIFLFLATVASTIFVGSVGFVDLKGGFLYSFALITILLTHEMGHYITSRHYGIPTTLPFFIPWPMPPFGTFGALIKMKGIILNRKALFDIGAAGPLSGFIVAIPFIIIGIKLSTVVSRVTIPDPSFMELGDSLLFTILEKLLIGDIAKGHELVLHPFAYAGWVGLFVTSLNLLPIGQLDGGHLIYAVCGPKSKWVYYAVIIGMAALTIFANVGWISLVILLVIFGRRHPEPYDDITELDGARKKIAIAMVVVFILSFIPSPFPHMTVGNLMNGNLFQ
jgi:membrane-associated protease RseP (regulator of RpoE activity)